MVFLINYLNFSSNSSMFFSDNCSEKRSSLSYVIINPSCDLKLEEGDNVYEIKFQITFDIME